RGSVAISRGRNDEAIAALHEAAIAAESVRDDALVSKSWRNLVYVMLVQGRLEEGLLWSRYEEATFDRVKSAPTTRAQVASLRAAILAQLGRTDEALAEARRAVELSAAPKTESEAYVAESARGNAAATLALLGHNGEALTLDAELYDDCLRRRGRQHPFTIQHLNSEAGYLLALDRFAEALPLAQLALENAAQFLGADAAETATAATELGAAEAGLGRL